MPSLKDLSTSHSRSVILDNLTLSSATRLISLKKDRKIKDLYPRLPVESMRGDKWDYDLNLGFRFGVDLACLAQLTQAIYYLKI